MKGIACMWEVESVFTKVRKSKFMKFEKFPKKF